MANENNNKNSVASQDQSSSQLIQAPTISLPKGGGAIKGMGEKFAANPVTGTGSLSIPIATSPGRSGFGPQLSLSYDSGAGNGPFGLGWNLSLPSITRKTDKGLPRYNDVEHSDVFILSGAEDLVPVLDSKLDPVKDEISVSGFIIFQYRPRIEGLFARIEHWLNKATGESHWRSISKDNITTLYGKTENARIADPTDNTRIFSWHICESYDDKGNAIVYEYQAEDEKNIDVANQANERNRTRTANQYIKRIKYGNKTPRQNTEGLSQRDDWLFEVVFDYGEHYTENTATQKCMIDFDGKTKTWPVRPDPFSSYRSGFEVRTYRLCQRVLMFHHFETELGNKNYLVKATELDYDQNPIFSLVNKVTQASFELDSGNTFHKRSLPPLEFTYTKAKINESVKSLDDDSLRNLPEGLDGIRYQWVDLDGEGLTGILTEQADAWYYKRNIGDGKFSEQELVARKPSLAALSSGRQQLLDLAGDGQLDLVEMDRPVSGFFERTVDENWESFVPFKSMPNIAWQDPNLKFIDLTGDGHADVLISENDVFTWYGSLAEAGFSTAQRVHKALEEENGPRLVFADGTQSIYLSDMCGDGLTDLVRIRNGEVCYWPNLGYGRFGAKVTMDNAPRFDYPDLFDQRRIRLADIDGSGVVDIIYLATDGINIYFNQSGNSLSPVKRLATFPKTDNLSAVQVADLFGNGTACLLWSSPLPGAAPSPLRYIDLMGGNKPHLLIETNNNLGGKTVVDYVASTKFYLEDKAAGTPWITKLPFPVHVVAKVTVFDKWRNTQFSSTYSYHHGYFDGIEREFRGFGRVEQIDVENYGEFMQGNIASPFITDDHNLYQPPIKTITWYHTGAAFDRKRILDQFSQEYFPARYLQGKGFQEKTLPEPELESDLSADEWREALRACKGMVLRQESYELDIEAIHAEPRREMPVRLYSAATHNCHIKRLQPKAKNQHAVFLVTESEAITYNYELDLTKELNPDPRIAHTLNLRFDDYGRSLQSIAIVYPRQLTFADPTNILEANQLTLIHTVQNERHLAYTETHYTNPLPDELHKHRLPPPCEVLTYELTGSDSSKGFTPSAGNYFTLVDFKAFILSDRLEDQGNKPVTKLNYEQQPTNNSAHKRLIEWVRILYFKDDLSGALPFKQYGWLGLTYETYKLALTKSLLDVVFEDKLTADVETKLNTATESGYIVGTFLESSFTNQYWMRSGIAGFANDAKDHFYLPEEYTDPFGNKTILVYDGQYDLFIQSHSDALGNTSRIEKFDYRVLAPREMVDANDNHSEVVFDVLGLPVAAAIKGKQTSPNDWQGDDLNGFDFALRNPPAQKIQDFCLSPTMDKTQAQTWLGNASTRFIYHFGDKNNQWAQCMAGACSIAREQHKIAASPLQVSLECSDGSGNVLMKKIQAEPEQANGPLRWIINGLTVLNNKGKPVKQYEPSFSEKGFGCEMPPEEGVTPIIYYDAAGRTIRTEMSDGTYSRVEFSPWHVTTFDANDTAFDPAQSNPKHSDWFLRRTDANHPRFAEFNSTENRRAAELVKVHANTPPLTLLDSLGRNVVAVAHNRIEDVNGTYTVGAKNYRNEYYLTFTKLDAEGKPLWICDARGNLVMQYINSPKANHTPLFDQTNPDWRPAYDMPPNAAPCYDIAGNLLFQHSMDAGDRWMMTDAAGKPMFAWDYNERTLDNGRPQAERRLFRTRYDALHRPLEQWLRINDDAPALIEAFEYCDTRSPNGAASLDDAKTRNLIGQAVRHYDPSGLATVERVDFKGAVEEVTRRLVSDVQAPLVDWNTANRAALLETDTFRQITEYDAFGRMTRLYNWHRDITFGAPGGPQATPGQTDRVAVYVPQYNARGVLQAEALHVRASKMPDADGHAQAITSSARSQQAIQAVTYNAKGQKLSQTLGNGTITEYAYYERTFRLLSMRTTRPLPSGDTCASTFVDQRIVQDLHYTYDPVGNIAQIEDAAQATQFGSNQRIDPINRYEYDALYRLILATGKESGVAAGPPLQTENWPVFDGCPAPDPSALRNYTQNYQYDSVGNFLQMHHEAGPLGNWTRDYRYAFDDPTQPASNRLWQTTAVGVTTTYRYDPHGSMLNLANTAPGQDIRWDWRDMIRHLDLIGGGHAYYNYGIDKQRTRKRLVRNPLVNDGTVKEDRIYLGGYELYRRYTNDPDDPIEEIESHHLFEGEQRVLMVDDMIKAKPKPARQPGPNGLRLSEQTLFRYQYGNHLGSLGLELDETARVISYEEFHPYGTSAYRMMNSAVEAPAKRYRYTGMERDDESGLSYHLSRYYVPWLGIFISGDSIGIKGDPNIFVYADRNPTNFVDNNGKCAWNPANEAEVVAKILEILEKAEWAFETEVAFNINVGGQLVGGRLDIVAHPPGKPDLQFYYEVKFDANSPLNGNQPIYYRTIEGGEASVIPKRSRSNVSMVEGKATSGHYQLVHKDTIDIVKEDIAKHNPKAPASIEARPVMQVKKAGAPIEPKAIRAAQVVKPAVGMVVNAAADLELESEMLMIRNVYKSTGALESLGFTGPLAPFFVVQQLKENSTHDTVDGYTYDYDTEWASIEWMLGLRENKPKHFIAHEKQLQLEQLQEEADAAAAAIEAKMRERQVYESERNRGLSGARGGTAR